MLTEKQKQVREKYRRRDSEGKVHCRECGQAIDTENLEGTEENEHKI